MLLVSSVLIAPVSRGEVSQASTASTAAIAIDRTQYFNQTSASAPVPQTLPFSLNLNIRGSSQDLSAWGPAFYKPGSGTVPQTGPSSATNTGTLNFSATPNNSGGYMFVHDFSTNADLVATYPLGAYGVRFQGAGKPTTPRTDDPFVAGLEFATSGSTYPSATPQIASANNGASWSGGTLKVNSAGVTTLTLNAFPEYSSSTYGSVITAGIYNPANSNVVANASVEAYYLPTLGVSQPAVTQLTIDGSWLTPGVNYVLEIQYVILASAPLEGYLNNENFQGVASYIKNTAINVTVDGGTTPPPTATADWLVRAGADFDGNGTPDILRENVVTGERTLWLMNGTTVANTVTIGTDADINWHMVGAGDFNSDGKPDILWQNLSTGARRVWMMNGTTFVSSVDLGTEPDTNWRIVGSADFDRDGKPDIIWQNISTGERKVWVMNGTTLSRSIGWSSDPDTRWRVCGAGDYDGNGTVDLLWQNIVTGERAIWQMNGTSFVHNVGLAADPDVRWRVLGTGDYSGHGSQDILWENLETGQVVLWIMNGTSYTGVANLNF